MAFMTPDGPRKNFRELDLRAYARDIGGGSRDAYRELACQLDVRGEERRLTRREIRAISDLRDAVFALSDATGGQIPRSNRVTEWAERVLAPYI